MSKATERIKLDNRLRLLIENGVNTNQRSVICLVGEQGRNQVVHIHNLMSKANIKSRPTVLWHNKKELIPWRTCLEDFEGQVPKHVSISL